MARAHERAAGINRSTKPERNMTNWIYDLSYFFGGAFLTNAMPHFLSGLMGQAFQTPFAKPPGKGLSSSTVNVMWGFFNLVIAYVLIMRVGMFNLGRTDHAVAIGLGMLLMGLMTARLFGPLHGGSLAGRA
jgi:hypothetical protein